MKKLIAAAVAAAIIAPASVMAAGPTLYGKIHMSIDYKDNNTSNSVGTEYKEWGVNSNSSRIGVKGSEDLGNGMKVGYLIEWDVNMDGDAGGSGLGQRNRAITLSGDWGTALLGRWDTPFKTVGRKLDLFGDKVGDTRNLTNSGTTDNRANNVLAYVTPNMSGFSATVAYVFDSGADVNTTGDNSDANAWSFNAIYNNGPILVALGYVDYNEDGLVPTGTAKPSTLDGASAWRLGGSYKIGDFKVVASYTDSDSQGFLKNNDPDTWTVGGSYTMGNNTIKLQYSDRDDSGLKSCGTSGTAKCKDGADMWSIGLDHAMSKRTSVYVAYADVDNEMHSASTVWGPGAGHDSEGNRPASGKSADAFSVGIIHKF